MFVVDELLGSRAGRKVMTEALVAGSACPARVLKMLAPPRAKLAEERPQSLVWEVRKNAVKRDKKAWKANSYIVLLLCKLERWC
jgi:hypothetical protein